MAIQWGIQHLWTNPAASTASAWHLFGPRCLWLQSSSRKRGWVTTMQLQPVQLADACFGRQVDRNGVQICSNMFKYSLMISLMLTIVNLYFLSTGTPWFWCSCIGFFPQHATGCRFGLLGILPLSLTARIEDQRRKGVYHGFLNWQIWDRWFIIIYHWCS
jgi:hypothetical protein